MSWMELVLLMLACFRLTHLLVFDTIAEPIRTALSRWSFTESLINCYWCCGIWVSALLLLLHAEWPAVARPVVLVLAIAGAQALLENLAQQRS